ncbi:hypothetical protein C2U36_27005, partial [Escherichia coli]
MAGKLVTIDNIQKTVAEYYKIKVADLLSKRSPSTSCVRRCATCWHCRKTGHHRQYSEDGGGV